MAKDPGSDTGATQAAPKPQLIPLSKIHNLPDVFIQPHPDKSYGGLVSSIQSEGVKEPVVLRVREDGEYQLVHGYRRKWASELAKKQEIPALIYEMTLQEAVDYHRRVQNNPSLPIPGKLIAAPTKDGPTSKEGKEAQAVSAATDPKPKTPPIQGKTEGKPDGKTPAEAPKETAPTKDDPTPKETQGPAAKGPAGTQITQVFQDRLAPPDEKALKDLPSPEEGESFFIVLHPGYLEKSKYNKITVNPNSEDYRELKKSIELNGVKDPVLTRINPDGGGLEIVSGQRRHMIAKELNYPVPAIIQKLDDADVMILVNDGNLHRPHISTYDLARALRGKMEGMKQKAGRRKKGSVTADELNSDEKLAQEMGMSVSKLNRMIRLSEATKDVCDRVDDGTLALSIASAISFLTPAHQDDVLRLSDLGYKLTNERIERAKEAEKTGKLDDTALRGILEDKDIAPKQNISPPDTAAKAQSAPPASRAIPDPPQPVSVSSTSTVPIPPSPDVKTFTNPPQTTAPTTSTSKDVDSLKGEQERPEYTKVILAGDRLRKYFPDVSLTPREIEESIYDALEERRQRQEKLKQKEIQVKKGPTR